MKKIVFGVIVIMAGTFLLVYNLGFLENYFKIVFSWESLLIALGAIQIADKRPQRKNFGIILVLVGLAFLLPKIAALAAPELLSGIKNMRGFILSIFIIALGIYFLCRSSGKNFFPHFARHHGGCHHGRRHQYDTENTDQPPFWKKKDFCGGYNREEFESMSFSSISVNDSGYIKRDYAFSASKERISSGKIKKAVINAAFSGVELDFSQVELSSDAEFVHIKVSSVFSGVTLFIPAEWNVLIRKTGVFGGFTDNRTVKPELKLNEKPVVLELEAVFGGGEVKYYE
ncbi:MAG: hypothetical protein LBH32_13615 [Dysgonamonadaceae bacterium]|jgi:hypothetical protein|nr:hypothetical protein [Dysgonamonadaceae bacterium]